MRDPENRTPESAILRWNALEPVERQEIYEFLLRSVGGMSARALAYREYGFRALAEREERAVSALRAVLEILGYNRAD